MYAETLLTQVVTKKNYTNKIHTRNMQAKLKKFANASWIRYVVYYHARLSAFLTINLLNL